MGGGRCGAWGHNGDWSFSAASPGNSRHVWREYRRSSHCTRERHLCFDACAASGSHHAWPPSHRARRHSNRTLPPSDGGVAVRTPGPRVASCGVGADGRTVLSTAAPAECAVDGLRAIWKKDRSGRRSNLRLVTGQLKSLDAGRSVVHTMRLFPHRLGSWWFASCAGRPSCGKITDGSTSESICTLLGTEFAYRKSTDHSQMRQKDLRNIFIRSGRNPCPLLSSLSANHRHRNTGSVSDRE